MPQYGNTRAHDEPKGVGLRLPKRLRRTIQNQIRLERGQPSWIAADGFGLILGRGSMCIGFAITTNAEEGSV